MNLLAVPLGSNFRKSRTLLIFSFRKHKIMLLLLSLVRVETVYTTLDNTGSQCRQQEQVSKTFDSISTRCVSGLGRTQIQGTIHKKQPSKGYPFSFQMKHTKQSATFSALHQQQSFTPIPKQASARCTLNVSCFTNTQSVITVAVQTHTVESVNGLC
jgi:hypothetical protein